MRFFTRILVFAGVLAASFGLTSCGSSHEVEHEYEVEHEREVEHRPR
jgi:hypothetical protein